MLAPLKDFFKNGAADNFCFFVKKKIIQLVNIY